jgi:hypothetical protein
VYPTKATEAERKGQTIRNISDRLERVEILLSRFVESKQVITGFAAGGDGEGQTQVPVQPGANVNAIGTGNQHSSNHHPEDSTWELLLNDEGVAQHASNSNIEILPEVVSQEFRLELRVLTPLCTINVPYIHRQS